MHCYLRGWYGDCREIENVWKCDKNDVKESQRIYDKPRQEEVHGVFKTDKNMKTDVRESQKF